MYFSGCVIYFTIKKNESKKKKKERENSYKGKSGVVGLTLKIGPQNPNSSDGIWPFIIQPYLSSLIFGHPLSSQVICHTCSQPCAFFTFTCDISLKKSHRHNPPFCQTKCKLSFQAQPGCHLPWENFSGDTDSRGTLPGSNFRSATHWWYDLGQLTNLSFIASSVK